MSLPVVKMPVVSRNYYRSLRDFSQASTEIKLGLMQVRRCPLQKATASTVSLVLPGLPEHVNKRVG